MTVLKICYRCKENKDTSLFSIRLSSPDGRSSHCKECDKVYRAENKESIAAKRKVYDEDHKEIRKSYRKENKERIAAQQRAYNVKHRKEITIKRRASDVKRKYRLEPTQYNALIAKGCGVCGSTENLHIDHDHNCCSGPLSCGKCVRGVLCAPHNKGEGFFKNVNEVLALVTYLQQFEMAQKESLDSPTLIW